MRRIVARWTAVLIAVAVLAAGRVSPAAAVDAPRWVAVVFVEAQMAVGLRWMAVPGATGYKVLRSEKSGADYKEITTAAQPQYFDATVERGTTYYYVLQAVAGAEVGPKSDEKTLTIPGQKQKTVKPPQWNKVVVQDTTEFGKTTYKVGLFWTPSSDAIAYNLYKSTESGKGYQLLLSMPEAQAVDVAVEGDKTYYYVLTALDGSFQETPYSAEQKVVIEKKKEVAAVRKKIRLELKPRSSKKVWSKARYDDMGKFNLWEPADLALDERAGLVYVSSVNTSQVYCLNADTGALVSVIGTQGKEPGQFLTPSGIGVDSDGLIYVSDRARRMILIFDGEKFKKEFPLEIPPNLGISGEPAPMDVTVEKSSGDIFVADAGLKRVWVFDSAGKFQRFLGEPGDEVGKLNYPIWLSFDPAGNLVVIDSGLTRVVTYKPDGTFLSSWGERKPGVGTFLFIGGHSYDKEGNILVFDAGSNTLQGFLPDGRYLYHVANADGTKGVELFAPKRVVVDSKNRIYFGEGLVDRVNCVELTGAVPPPQEEPFDAAPPAAK